MKYFNEMDTRWGFDEGMSIPPDAEACREVYVKVLNGLLRKNNSKCRIIPYNSSTIHNPLLWLRVDIPTYNKSLSQNLENTEEIEPDDAWNNSIEEAYELDLDSYIECEPKIDWNGLENNLGEILNENN